MTLQPCARVGSEHRVVVVFQPHRYTRTAPSSTSSSGLSTSPTCWWCCRSYAASEEPIAGITGQALSERIKAHGHKQVIFAEGIAAAAVQLKSLLMPGTSC